MQRVDASLFWVFGLSLCLAMLPVHAQSTEKPPTPPTPPTQRDAGPGSKHIATPALIATAYGQGAEGYWIIEPAQRVEQPRPVVLFVHGMNLTSYGSYRSWITHLIGQGNVVIYPRYQIGGVVDPTTFTAQTAIATHKALDQCDGKKHARIDRKRLTMIGHSLGGTIIANLAARPKHFGLPAPRALMLLQPGDTKADKGLGAFFPSLTEDHSTIPAGTLMLIVDVKDDWFVSPKDGQRIYDKTKLIDASDKGRLLMHSDAHGEPALVADHFLPMAWSDRPGQFTGPGQADAYDFALWRWFDALQATAEGDKSQRRYVLGNTPEQRDMGKWSDGTPVREPEVYEPK